MSILINFKICDNSPDCNGIKSCPMKAFYFDEEKQSIAVNPDLCTNCGRCVNSCLVGAIRLAKNQVEYEKIQKEMDEDPRTVNDLFVDRYGAVPISNKFTIKMDEYERDVLKSTKLTVLEIYDDDSIQCLIKSIPIKELFHQDIVYRKMQADEHFIAMHNVEVLPALLFFKDGKCFDKIEGFYGVDRKDVLLEEISKII